MLKKLTFCLFLLAVFTSFTFSQVNEVKDVFVCKKIENIISKSIAISKVRRHVAYEDECDLDVKSGKDEFLISTEKYKTQKEAKEEFLSNFNSFTIENENPNTIKKFPKNDFWNNAKGHYEPNAYDHLILLRYKNIVITLIGTSYTQLFTIKLLLRNVPFEKYAN